MNIAKELNTLRDIYAKDDSTRPCFNACMRVFAGFMEQVEGQLKRIQALKESQ